MAEPVSKQTAYGDDFFDYHEDRALASARSVVPIVLQLVGARSVVDVGCGRGEWLRTFHERGVTRVCGYDGAHVDRTRLLIPPECFHAVDLARPFSTESRFDLALCLEVGEHLPTRSARGLVKSLCEAAPVVIFSAAIPGQGGTHHINEQWPDFWRRLFAAQGYVRIDCLRQRIWEDASVARWYRQNMFVFVREDARDTYPLLVETPDRIIGMEFEIVAPHVLGRLTSFSGILRELSRAFIRAVKQRTV